MFLINLLTYLLTCRYCIIVSVEMSRVFCLDKRTGALPMDVISVRDGYSAVNDAENLPVYDELSDYDYQIVPAVETVYSEPENESPSSPSATSMPPIETGYSGLEPSTRELPVVYEETSQNEYADNEETSTPAVETVYSEQENETPPVDTTCSFKNREDLTRYFSYIAPPQGP